MLSRLPDRTGRSPLDAPTIPWVIATAALVGAIALALWAASMRGELAEAEDQVAALTAERDQLREASTAQVFDLSPTAQGPANAGGTLYLQASGSGVLNVVNLPALEEGQAYQAWFLPPDEGEPIPGGTFAVDDRGVGFLLVSADVGAIRGVSISAEPADGSTTPSGTMVLSGTASGARG